jgi:hypothetical protein
LNNVQNGYLENEQCSRRIFAEPEKNSAAGAHT